MIGTRGQPCPLAEACNSVCVTAIMSTPILIIAFIVMSTTITFMYRKQKQTVTAVTAC